MCLVRSFIQIILIRIQWHRELVSTYAFYVLIISIVSLKIDKYYKDKVKHWNSCK